MTDATPILELPLLMPAQAQKHVTHNEALRLLDIIVQLAVLDRDRTAPPPSPAEGDRHIVAPGATGDWAGQDHRIAAWWGGSWAFVAPLAGWRAEVLAEDLALTFDGAGWADGAGRALRAARLGIAATPDATNRLAVSSPAVLLNHAGAGVQLKLNKARSPDTASLLYQTGWSGRAEMGLAGDDRFAIKVSPDGANWAQPLTLDAAGEEIALAGQLRVTRDGAAGPVASLTRAGADAGTGAEIGLARIGGTLAAPLALTNGAAIGRLSFSGHDGSEVTGPVALIAVTAAQGWAAGKNGTRLALALTAIDEGSPREVLAIEADGRATLSGHEVFCQGNLIGTVSQSGGVPTGAWSETGTNANGTYLRFADGRQECEVMLSASTVNGKEWVFPAAFSAGPVVAGIAKANASACVCLDEHPTTTSVVLSIRDKNDARKGGNMHLRATGRWF